LKAEGVVAEARVQGVSHVLVPMPLPWAPPRHLTWQGGCRSMTAKC